MLDMYPQEDALYNGPSGKSAKRYATTDRWRESDSKKRPVAECLSLDSEATVIRYYHEFPSLDSRVIAEEVTVAHLLQPWQLRQMQAIINSGALSEHEAMRMQKRVKRGWAFWHVAQRQSIRAGQKQAKVYDASQIATPSASWDEVK